MDRPSSAPSAVLHSEQGVHSLHRVKLPPPQEQQNNLQKPQHQMRNPKQQLFGVAELLFERVGIHLSTSSPTSAATISAKTESNTSIETLSPMWLVKHTSTRYS